MRSDGEMVVPSDGGCAICWHGAKRGLMVYDESAGGVWVHTDCLKWFGVNSYTQYERMYVDRLK